MTVFISYTNNIDRKEIIAIKKKLEYLGYS